jgi:hypothetical protein
MLPHVVAAFLVLETIVNLGALVLYRDAMLHGLLARYAVGGISADQVQVTAESALFVISASVVLYSAIQLVLASLTVKFPRSVWTRLADAVWLAVLGISGLLSMVGSRADQSLQPIERLYVAWALAAIAAVLAMSTGVEVVRRLARRRAS